MRPYRTFWQYLWSGFPLILVWVFIGGCTTVAIKEGNGIAIALCLTTLGVAVIMGVMDYRHNG